MSRWCPVAGQAKQTALAQVLVMTDVLFKSIDPHQIPAELELIIDFDVPLRKVAQLNRAELSKAILLLLSKVPFLCCQIYIEYSPGHLVLVVVSV